MKRRGGRNCYDEIWGIMNKVQPILRRRYCVCGRPCGDTVVKSENIRDSAVLNASNAPSSGLPRTVQSEKSVPIHPTPTPPSSDSLSLLQLKIRALEKYKTNYELLCSQLAELNTQVGLQLQRHEVDVTTLQSTIQTLQTTNTSLEQELHGTKQQLQSLQTTSEKDREYANGVHKQLTTVTELLKTAEKRLKEQENDYQCEVTRHQETQNEVQRCVSIKQTLETEISSLKEQVAQAMDSEKMRRKHHTEIKNLKLDMEHLRDELEQQRAMTRQSKKLLKHTRDERDALVKQLEHIKSDGMQLTTILEAQREEMIRQDKKAQRWKKMVHDSEIKLSEAMQNVDDLEVQLTSVQEELVGKNAKVEKFVMEVKEWKQRLEVSQSETKNMQLEVGTLKVQLERVQNEYEAFKAKEVETAVRKDEQVAQELQRRYQQDLEQMKQLLSLNQQRTTESSHDMQVLKQELGSVQLLLRQCHQQKRGTRRRNDLTSSSDGSEVRSWHMRRQRAEVENAVLQSAIMDQVKEAW